MNTISIENPEKPNVRLSPINQRFGFTLVELLISIAVISILAGLAAQTFRAVLDARAVAMIRIEVNETGRSALDYIASDLRSAYLTPDSVLPYDPRSSGTDQIVPRFRFVGIHRDVEVEPGSDVPGAGVDDDGDGLIDEEVLDGIDGDYPSGAASSLRSGNVVADPLNCEDSNDARCIDEDIGLFPSDILHFVTAIDNSGDIILQEISYGLDPSGTRLIRRAQVLSLDSNNFDTKLKDFGQFIDNSTGKRLVPPIGFPIASVVPQQLQTAISNWDLGARYGQLQSESDNFTNQNPAKIFQVLAYDIRGLRFRYLYYDYNRGGWRIVNEWDSSRETALMTPGQKLFNLPATNDSIEGRSRLAFENIVVNEASDMYPKAAPGNFSRSGYYNQFLVQSPSQILSSQDYASVAERILEKTDGLPNMVEITIYVQDRDRTLNPRLFTTRVFVPNNYRSIGV